MNVALDLPVNRSTKYGLDRSHFTTPVQVAARALLHSNLKENWLQENKDAVNARLELSFEQSRNGNLSSGTGA